MKKSTLITLLVFLVVMPLTLYVGRQLSGRWYYLTGTLIIVEAMIPFFLGFEGRKPQARYLVVIAVMCALAIASRVIVPIPHFKPTFAIILLAGIAFGPEAGFTVGAMCAFCSNFFLGQGPFTPWQMMAYGAGGLLSGFLTRMGWLGRNRWVLGIFGFLASVLWVGPLLDFAGIILMLTYLSWDGAMAIMLSGVPVNLTQGVSTFLTMVLFSKPLLEKLDRIKVKYGMVEDSNGL